MQLPIHTQRIKNCLCPQLAQLLISAAAQCVSALVQNTSIDSGVHLITIPVTPLSLKAPTMLAVFRLLNRICSTEDTV